MHPRTLRSGDVCLCNECWDRRDWETQYDPGATASLRDQYRREYNPSPELVNLYTLTVGDAQQVFTQMCTSVVDRLYYDFVHGRS